jgi:hypothetical protein
LVDAPVVRIAHVLGRVVVRPGGAIRLDAQRDYFERAAGYGQMRADMRDWAQEVPV